VVVVELAGTAGVEVVVVLVVVGVVQPDSAAMATAAKHAIISFFIGMIFWFIVLQAQNYVIGWS
jgi:uncharacterized membrane protein YbhN (UPF0104 family)